MHELPEERLGVLLRRAEVDLAAAELGPEHDPRVLAAELAVPLDDRPEGVDERAALPTLRRMGSGQEAHELVEDEFSGLLLDAQVIPLVGRPQRPLKVATVAQPRGLLAALVERVMEGEDRHAERLASLIAGRDYGGQVLRSPAVLCSFVGDAPPLDLAGVASADDAEPAPRKVVHVIASTGQISHVWRRGRHERIT